jgi:hypothetical protein
MNPYKLIYYKQGVSERAIAANNDKFWHWEGWAWSIKKMATVWLLLNIKHGK